MTATISRAWRRQLLTAIVEQGVTVHLYRNDYTPAPESVLADFEELPKAAGYAPVTIPAGEWSISDALPIARHEEGVRFAFTAKAGMVYGYYMTTAGGVFLGAERADRFPLDVHAFDGIQIVAQISI